MRLDSLPLGFEPDECSLGLCGDRRSPVLALGSDFVGTGARLSSHSDFLGESPSPGGGEPDEPEESPPRASRPK
jgi:hypothetical protein